MAEGATASVYVAGSLCSEAQGALDDHGARVGEVRLRVKCLPEASDLASIGAGARQATEDSSTVAYVGPPDPVAVRFLESILEAAGIARISTSSGAAAMDRLITAIGEAGDAGNLRESVKESLESG